jgi:hypothetical protein
MSQPEQFDILILERAAKSWRGYGAIGAMDGRGRAEVDRGLLSQYRLPPQQERGAHLSRKKSERNAGNTRCDRVPRA